MKMKRMSSLFCAVTFFGTASVAMAGAYGEPEQAEEIPRPAPVEEVAPAEGFSPFVYVGAGAIYAEPFFDANTKQKNNEYGWGYNLRVGYRFHEMVAVELLGEQVIEFDADQGTDRDTWALMPNLKVFLMEGFCEPYLSVGGGVIGADDGGGVGNDGSPRNANSVQDGYGFAARFGGGIDLYATENIFIEPELAYVLPTGDASTYDYLVVGLSIGYAFN